MNPQTPNSFDTITLFHWLWWRLQCLEASPQEFQRLFEKAAIRVRPDFARVRPYGKLGDRKCDGLWWGDGTVFQVYSPDQLKLKETLDKIEEDLAGAVAEWGSQLRTWVFVYNTRLGVAADVLQLLDQQKTKYPHLTIEPLSSEMLWEVMRGLSLQQRAEILGAPSGYEYLYLSPVTGAGEVAGILDEGLFFIVHDVLASINVSDAVKALEPRHPFGPPFYVRPPFPEDSWELAAEHQATVISDLLEKGRHLLPRFAVFSLAPIPLAVHLGHLLSDQVEVLPFQYDRDRKTWSWDTSRSTFDTQFHLEGVPKERVDGSVEVIIRVSLSAPIQQEDTIAVAGESPVQIDLRVDNPDVTWLSHPDQLRALEQEFRNLLNIVNRLVPQCQLLHLFYAGPTGGAVVLGQVINPRMNPKVALYQYERRQDPRYKRVLTLE